MKITDFKRKKALGEKISFLTCYDYPSACIIAETELDCVLVGDSVAMAVHGYETTVMATIEMMEFHTRAVARGIQKQFLVSDLPFLAHKGSQQETVANVRRLLQAGAQAVKIEGGDLDTCKTIAHLVAAGVPVVGHIGLTPQSVHQLGGYKVQGKTREQAEQLLNQAKDLESAGCCALVLECVPQNVAQHITNHLSIPTIGIGAGVGTDGQVLVWHDMLGLNDFKPHFLKQYCEGKAYFRQAINDYIDEVRHSQFPAEEHAF
ncbi:3-methyl-2-oxobutanoate hydroxymethyltransferase [Legionella quinlivanii]|uniref:3-methyl-2-oxobutanoate hydroxymethyltransferase n=1 Tax=Legionella quinlivanii TaxID=45073 RepID=A0A0W0Y590_9GAMM|nr:3-methyl-2-oxobutanoate hydroxymethyltransferase [Legionella quinlivanii]KTD52155.1 3-methyl-2-oxobutanoate hydroxymethyltransferase [Legionella quinlivanii]MCW8452419.1 3-methyl-2-oxobutanoate hydroxymethyltransferase [Legionella quinlivanii]SEF77164.1 ketopantoate hydroxymethyltransferase [Legionella quinlivanii DSM 21216]STY12346.1 3-methyl-2-oxobutanoate hydroxymethyltransferase [Legionella quinlivanii]